MDAPVEPAGRSAPGTAPAPACTLVIFGAGGDLTKRLLMPALYDLAGSGLLSEELVVLGLDRADNTDEGWAGALTEAMESFTRDPTADAGRFRRVVVEKPFGRDLPSAGALDREVLAAAGERQLYRIDLFLGKDSVQSILAVRFANRLFEPAWNRDHVDHVQITAAETIGVERRGAFYEPTGALRDMVPNHLFQLLCMAAMEPPDSLDAEAVRTAKAELVQAVRPVRPEDAVRGQYAAGRLAAGQDARAYREEPHVAADSRTETYAALKLSIDNARWAGVPFYLRTGKRLATRRTEIAVRFKAPPRRLFREAAGAGAAGEAELVRFLIDPEQGIETRFGVKVPGPEMRLGRAAMAFRYGDIFPERPNVGYETLLYDCMLGDATLFQRADNVEAGWAAVQPLLDAWRTGGPEPYAAGGEGPAGADALLARDGRSWRPLAGG